MILVATDGINSRCVIVLGCTSRSNKHSLVSKILWPEPLSTRISPIGLRSATGKYVLYACPGPEFSVPRPPDCLRSGHVSAGLKRSRGGAERPRMRPETAENRRCPAGSGADPAPTGSGAAVHQNFGGNPNVKFVSNLCQIWICQICVKFGFTLRFTLKHEIQQILLNFRNVKFVSNRDLLNFWGPGLGFPPESAGFPPEFWISAGIRRNPPELWFSI